MAQYPIPQFIEAEGKIISFLTFRQFFILVGGGAICALFYYTLPFFIFATGSIFVAIITAAVAVLKVDNDSIVTVVRNALGYFIASKNYIWKKKEAPYPLKNNPSHQLAKPAALSKLKETKGIVEYRKRQTRD